MKKLARVLALILRWISILPSAVFGLTVNAVVRVAWGQSSRWDRGIWWVVLDAKSWPMRSWYRQWAGTTFGPLAVMLAPAYEHNAEVIRHEAHHAEQADAQAIAAFVVACALAALQHFWLAFIVWAFLGRLVYLSAHVVAVSRGENPYAGNVMEEGAYAVGREVPK